MGSTVLIPKHRVQSLFMKSDSHAHNFAQNKVVYNELMQKKEAKITELGGKTSTTMMILAPIVLVAVGGIIVYEANTLQTVITSFLDPFNTGAIISPVIAQIIGFALALIGILSGHFIFEGIERDETTGERNLTRVFWFGILLSLVFIAAQYFLVKTAGADVESGENMPKLVLFLALLEFLVGAVMLEKALSYTWLTFMNIRRGFRMWRMRQNARKTNNVYRNYLTMLTAFNDENPSRQALQPEGNRNIQAAIAFYSGEPLQNVADTTVSDNQNRLNQENVNLSRPANPPIQQEGVTNSQNSANQSPVVNSNQNYTNNNPNQQIQDFLEDSIEDDLTV